MVQSLSNLKGLQIAPAAMNKERKVLLNTKYNICKNYNCWRKISDSNPNWYISFNSKINLTIV